MASRSMFFRCTPIAAGDLIVLQGHTMKVLVCMSIDGAPTLVADVYTEFERLHVGAVKLQLASRSSVIDLAMYSVDGIYHKACWHEVEPDNIIALL